MVELHEGFPAYGFAEHKGYVTPEHSAALRRARAVRRAPLLLRQRGRPVRGTARTSGAGRTVVRLDDLVDEAARRRRARRCWR